ncbi:unnamed protein product, partial [Ilex paraguariensis]
MWSLDLCQQKSKVKKQIIQRDRGRRKVVFYPFHPLNSDLQWRPLFKTGQFGHLEQGLNGAIRAFKPGRSDSPVRGFKIPTSPELNVPKNLSYWKIHPAMMMKKIIEKTPLSKANAELEPPALDSRDE